jgi:hypothetical protein
VKLRPCQKYKIIRQLARNKKTLCAIAQVSRSGYYEYLKSADNPEKDNDDYLLVKEIFANGKGKYGWRTIQMKLSTEKGLIMNHKKIIRIKDKYSLITKIRRVNPKVVWFVNTIKVPV